jgi:hypothetical protein
MKINFERIKYSPLGKGISHVFKFSAIYGILTVPLSIILCMIFFAISAVLGWVMLPVAASIPVLTAYLTARDSLPQARLLSDMTDSEHEKLIAEYKKYGEKNTAFCGHLTSYGIVLDEGILPWNAISKIKFSPGEYKLVNRRNEWLVRVYYHPQITVYANIEKELSISQYLRGEAYDLSDEIASFIESIPEYTEHSFEIDNEYYFAKEAGE